MSPIRTLDSHLISSAARIAPEKCQSLNAFCIKHDPCAVFTNDKKFSFRVDTDSKEIMLPTAALEYLWCACYTFYVVYKEYCAANDGQENELDINNNVNTKSALLLYTWGIEQLNQTNHRDWPSDYARPGDTNATEEVTVANELYLCAFAWIFFHELGHIELAHPNEPISDQESRDQEREADDFATKWILEGVVDEKIREKRGLGIAIATLVLTSQDILSGRFEEKTHPKSFERLYRAISGYFSDEDHIVYAFSTVILHLNMTLSDMQIEKNDNDTWKQNLESCLCTFCRLS